MKKIAILSLLLLMTLCACGKQEAAEIEESVPSTTEAVVETSEEPTVPIVEETTEPETLPEETAAPTVEVPTEPEGVAGTVIARSLNVREEPSVNAKRVAKLPKGTRVTIYEEQLIAGITWGHIDEGWVAMDYILKGDATAEKPDVQKPAEPKASESIPTEPKPTEPSPTEPKLTEPKPTDSRPTEPIPAESRPAAPTPAEHEPSEPAPAQCQHQWNVIQNIPAEYAYHYYVVCACGAKFPDSASWIVHSDSYRGEELLNHTGYASGSDKTEVSPPMTTWQCASCGAGKTISSWDNP